MTSFGTHQVKHLREILIINKNRMESKQPVKKEILSFQILLYINTKTSLLFDYF